MLNVRIRVKDKLVYQKSRTNVLLWHTDPQPSGTISVVYTNRVNIIYVYIYIYIYIHRLAAQRDRVGDSLSCAPKA